LPRPSDPAGQVAFADLLGGAAHHPHVREQSARDDVAGRAGDQSDTDSDDDRFVDLGAFEVAELDRGQLPGSGVTGAGDGAASGRVGSAGGGRGGDVQSAHERVVWVSIDLSEVQLP
jgi:hypothetical protein